MLLRWAVQLSAWILLKKNNKKKTTQGTQEEKHQPVQTEKWMKNDLLIICRSFDSLDAVVCYDSSTGAHPNANHGRLQLNVLSSMNINISLFIFLF